MGFNLRAAGPPASSIYGSATVNGVVAGLAHGLYVAAHALHGIAGRTGCNEAASGKDKDELSKHCVIPYECDRRPEGKWHAMSVNGFVSSLTNRFDVFSRSLYRIAGRCRANDAARDQGEQEFLDHAVSSFCYKPDLGLLGV